MNALPRLGAWIASGSFAAIEIAAKEDVSFFVIDAEHGAIDESTLNAVIPLVHSYGKEVLVKVRAPERASIQRALDFGANGVIIPHIQGTAHAREVCGYAKFPPLGDRSLAAERALGYGSLTPEWIADQDRSIKCYPMIEDESALLEIEQIVALPVVDGVFPGPSDLAIRRGRGCYERTEDDFADIRRIADACKAAGKSWILPAWSEQEQELAINNGAHGIVVANEYTALSNGFAGLVSAAKSRFARTSCLSPTVSAEHPGGRAPDR
ncbi:HpcH/HpaI aldolase/citrate lyase family protein [Paenarthrobacter sp. NPDC090520]|uniref:HpcH/HpaI aldolase family protein n=1 Tax=Paenarthrobacter sp. NPDC090520 TaxID=3364382 RepID=UPI00382417FC